VDPKTFQVDVRAFSIRRAWSGEDDVALQTLDAVTVFSSVAIPAQHLDRGPVRGPGPTPCRQASASRTCCDAPAGDADATGRGDLPAPQRRYVARAPLREFVPAPAVDSPAAGSAVAIRGQPAVNRSISGAGRAHASLERRPIRPRRARSSTKMRWVDR